MSKRNNITYVKPQEPSFLAKLKAEIGYKEGPTVDTKRQKLEERDDDDYDSSEEQRPEREDEKPQIVVLARGDLTADEVALEQQRIAKEEAERPADLNQPIVFKQRVKQTNIESSDSSKTDGRTKKSDKAEKRKKAKASASASSKLSFNEDEEDAEADED
ncbi:hypothetical protein KR222_008354 [Zaprionus bogoriensis]|nr:hypothetical protein KR222_008354 [Zaprionus bogoriensis]